MREEDFFFRVKLDDNCSFFWAHFLCSVCSYFFCETASSLLFRLIALNALGLSGMLMYCRERRFLSTFYLIYYIIVDFIYLWNNIIFVLKKKKIFWVPDLTRGKDKKRGKFCTSSSLLLLLHLSTSFSVHPIFVGSAIKDENWVTHFSNRVRPVVTGRSKNQPEH